MIFKEGELPSYEEGEMMMGNIFNKRDGTMDSWGWYAYYWMGQAYVLRHKVPDQFLIRGIYRKLIPVRLIQNRLEVVGIISIGSKMGGIDDFLNNLKYFPKLNLDTIKFDKGPELFDHSYEFRPQVYTRIR